MRLPKIFLVLLLGGFQLSCYPRYSGEETPVNKIFLFVELKNRNSLVLGSPVGAEMCLAGEGSLRSIATWDPEIRAFVSSETYRRCDDLQIADASEIARTLQISENRLGLLELKGPILDAHPDRCFVDQVRLALSSRLLVCLAGSEIQIVLGSYGNREGTEEEHRYLVTDNSSERKEVAHRFSLARSVRFEWAPDF